MNKRLRAVALAAAVGLSAGLAAPPAMAEDPIDPRAEVERLARDAARTIVAALSLLVAAIPQYELPEILPNGDIIIRRKNPSGSVPRETPEPMPEDEGDFDKT